MLKSLHLDSYVKNTNPNELDLKKVLNKDDFVVKLKMVKTIEKL